MRLQAVLSLSVGACLATIALALDPMVMYRGLTEDGTVLPDPSGAVEPHMTGPWYDPGIYPLATVGNASQPRKDLAKSRKLRIGVAVYSRSCTYTDERYNAGLW